MYLYFDDLGKLYLTSTIANASFTKDGKRYNSPIFYDEYISGHDYKIADGEIVDLGEMVVMSPE